MLFKVFVDENAYHLEIPDTILQEGADFFAKMDRDMDRGWQMSRDYVEHPDAQQRCQIVANKLLTSMMNGKKTTALLMAGYIISRMPGVAGVDIDTSGEMQQTELVF